MSTQCHMSIDVRYTYLRCMKARYEAANRTEKGALLDEMQKMTHLHRKSLIRRMNGPLTRKARTRQRGCTYGPEVDSALCIIAEAFDHICAERLTPNLTWMAQHLADHGELYLTPTLLHQLETISVSTVRRLLSRHHPILPRLPRKRPRPPNSLTRDIPMRRIPWDTPSPGHFEVDLVHHSGPSTSGHYVHSLQMVDVATGWSERRAVLGRSWLVMQDAFRHILADLPFPIRELHPDNGNEFFNHHLLRFWEEATGHITLSRSRPFHKNDNPFVEQKNSSLIRAYLGHERLDTVEQTRLLNQLYQKMGLYYNLFQPVMRVVEKDMVPESGGQPARLVRRYDTARTPFQRLCETDVISDSVRERLEALRDSINPRKLREEIYHLLDELFALPNAVVGDITENVHDTLHYPLLPEPTDASTQPIPERRGQALGNIII